MTNKPPAFWQCQYEVRYGEANRQGQLKLRAMADYFQEAAAHHADNLGVGLAGLAEVDMLWVLSRMGIEVTRLPMVNEVIQLTTWPRRGTSPLFAMREFTMHSLDGELLVRATSAWLLLDSKSFRPRRVSMLPVELPENVERNYLYQQLDEIPDFEGKAVFCEQIRESKIDVNQHLNNAEYFSWLEDCAAMAGYKPEDGRRLFINFVNEVKCGDIVEICSVNNPADHEITLGGIKKSDGRKAFRAVMSFGK